MSENRYPSQTSSQSESGFDFAHRHDSSDVELRNVRSPRHVRRDLEERRAMIGLSMIDGVGPRRLNGLIAHFGSARSAMEAAPSVLARIPGIGKQCAKKIASYQLGGDVEHQIQAADRVGAFMIAESDETYPPLLREIYLPPPFFWVRGEIPIGPFVAIVGTRRPSDYGRHIARKIAADLVAAGVVIVSGLAYGIDQVAHQAALDAGGSTVAVLGSGIDNIYPDRHIPLARRIEKSGALLSEFPLGTKPDGPNFPQRNRIISGMCLGTVVIEAYEKGGALITALFANEQNREVFAVPGRVTSACAAGTNQLIRDGVAKLVVSADDVLAELAVPQDGKPVQRIENRTAEMDQVSRKIISALGSDVKHIEYLFEQTGLAMGDLLSALMTLEVNGFVTQYPGKSFAVKD